MIAWGLPAAQTVAALVRRDVDPDELTGNKSKTICHILKIRLCVCQTVIVTIT